MERSRLDLILGVVAIAALASAGWMYTANRSLRHDVEEAQAARRALEINALATSERDTTAESAKVAAETAIAELKAQMAETEKANAARAQADTGPANNYRGLTSQLRAKPLSRRYIRDTTAASSAPVI